MRIHKYLLYGIHKTAEGGMRNLGIFSHLLGVISLTRKCLDSGGENGQKNRLFLGVKMVDLGGVFPSLDTLERMGSEYINLKLFCKP